MCGKELGLMKYTPKKEWNLGHDVLCSDCFMHLDESSRVADNGAGKDLSADELKRLRKEYERATSMTKPKWKEKLNSRGYLKFLIVLGVFTTVLGLVTSNMWSIVIGATCTAIAVVRLMK